MSDGSIYRIITDHLGSVRLVVNAATGSIAQKWDYDEWGVATFDEAASSEAIDFQPFGFAGGLYDPDTGLVRFGARDYDAETGRWTAKDPSLFRGGVNLYAYVHNDPINYFDHTGRFELPANPAGLGPEWSLDPTHLYPHGQRWRHPSGDYLDYHPGRPGMPGKRAKTHWHWNGEPDHLFPGDEVPDPEPVCTEEDFTPGEPDEPIEYEPVLPWDRPDGRPFIPILPLPFPFPLPIPGWGPIPVPFPAPA